MPNAFIQLPTIRLHVAEAGQGPLVLLLHGFPETHHCWRHQIQPLVGAGFRVVAVDQRGFGASETDGPYDLATLTQDMASLIEALGPERSVRVVGHDWGGAVAWSLAAHRPDLVGRLSVANCPHPRRLSEVLFLERNMGQLRRSWYMGFFQLPWLPEWWLRRDNGALLVRMLRGSARDKTNFSSLELEPLRRAVRRPGVAEAMIGWYRAIPLSSRQPTPKDRLAMPVQLIWGTADTALDFETLVPGTERFVENLTVHPLPGVGHFCAAEAPSAFNAALLPFLQAPTSE